MGNTDKKNVLLRRKILKNEQAYSSKGSKPGGSHAGVVVSRSVM